MELTDKNNAYVIRKSACSAIWNFGGSGKIRHHSCLTHPPIRDQITNSSLCGGARVRPLIVERRGRVSPDLWREYYVV